MAETTKIEWCDATFNPWTGCTKWGPDCDGCYAAAFSLRVGGPEYKKGVPRRRCAGFEKSALALARKAAKLGKRLKVFPSLCDVFDAEAPPEWRADFWRVVDATRDRLDWLILTKRTENVAGMLPDGWGDGWAGVWLGMSAGDQKTFDRRVGAFMAVPVSAVRFLSYEPAFGPLSADNDLHRFCRISHCYSPSGVPMHEPTEHAHFDWVIIGGESGPGARPFDLDWARQMLKECAHEGVAVFFKQGGASHACQHESKGGCLECMPADLRVREWPAILMDRAEAPKEVA